MADRLRFNNADAIRDDEWDDRDGGGSHDARLEQHQERADRDAERADVPLAQKDWPAFRPPTCRCGHTGAEHGRASAGLHHSAGRCFKCDCPRFDEARGEPGDYEEDADAA